MRHHRCGNIQKIKKFFIPFQCVDIEQHRTGGVAHVRDVLVSAGQVPHQPTVHCAEAKLSLLGTLTGSRYILKDPAYLRSGEISVDDEAGLAADHIRHSRGLERVAIFRSPSILPHDGIINRFSCLGVPHDSGLALVGDSDGGDVRSPKSKRCDRLSHHRIFGGPDLHRIVLHHPRLREMLCEFLLANGHSLAPLIENNGS